MRLISGRDRPDGSGQTGEKMKSLAKQLREWIKNNDFYGSGVLTNELKLDQSFGQHIRKITLQLDYHGQNIIAAQIQKSLNCLLDKCRKIDDVCRAGCRDQEQLLELDFIRSRAVGLANELAELLEMAETNVISTLPTEDRTEATTKQTQERTPPKDKWITCAQAAGFLGVSRSTVSRWAKKGKLSDNGEKGQKRRLLRTSLLLIKQQREDEDLVHDVEELRADARRF